MEPVTVAGIVENNSISVGVTRDRRISITMDNGQGDASFILISPENAMFFMNAISRAVMIAKGAM